MSQPWEIYNRMQCVSCLIKLNELKKKGISFFTKLNQYELFYFLLYFYHFLTNPLSILGELCQKKMDEIFLAFSEQIVTPYLQFLNFKLLYS